jgi:5-methylcytosine-specific restriction endonuclease McrA
MPTKAPRVCGCGNLVASNARCLCEIRNKRDRDARNDAKRGSARERGYGSKWQIERVAYLKANPKCRRCGSPATIVDHIIPHKGDRKIFWNRGNWQPLCVSCHSGWKQHQESIAP